MEDTRSQDHHMDDKEMYMDIEDEQIGVENQSALWADWFETVTFWKDVGSNLIKGSETARD